MKRLLNTTIILLSFINSYSQQIQNVKAVQQGSSVLVSYDLNDQTGKPYYVKLLMSKDGGTTFGDELKYVTGDVKNTKAGIGKQIKWDAAQEISYYDGNAVFRVEAAVKAAPMPEPIELKYSKIEITNVKAAGGRVIVDFIVIATNDADLNLRKYKSLTSLFDNSGNQFEPSSGKFGDQQLDYDKKLLAGIPVKAQLIFDNVPNDLTIAPLIKICVQPSWGSDQNSFFQFRNVPISR